MPALGGPSSPTRVSGTYSTTSPAYILDLSPNGMGAVRQLARLGVSVRGFDCDRSREGFRSRFGRREVCPDPVNEPERLLAFLQERASAEPARPFLLPANDKFVLFFLSHQEPLARHFDFVCPPEAQFRALLSKEETFELAAGAGIATPRSLTVEPGAGIDGVPEDFPFPALFKPSMSFSLWGVTRGKVVMVRNRDEAARVAGSLPAGAGFVLQEVIPGEENRLVFYSTYRDRSGRCRAEFLSRKVRQYPPGLGTGSLFESFRDEELLATGRALFDHLQYRGLATSEFKRDPRDGVLKLIEVNPRLWLFHPLSVPAGVHFVLTAYLDATGQEVPEQVQSAGTVKWQHFLHDAVVSAYYLRSGRWSFRDWRESVRGPKAMSVWDPADPLPFLCSAWAYAVKGVRRKLAATRGGGGRAVPELTWDEQLDALENGRPTLERGYRSV